MAIFSWKCYLYYQNGMANEKWTSKSRKSFCISLSTWLNQVGYRFYLMDFKYLMYANTMTMRSNKMWNNPNVFTLESKYLCYVVIWENIYLFCVFLTSLRHRGGCTDDILGVQKCRVCIIKRSNWFLELCAGCRRETS